MSFFIKSLSAAAVLAAATSAVNAAVTLAWTDDTATIPASAFVNSATNPSINGRLSGAPGQWFRYQLRITLSGGDQFGGGRLRAALGSAGAFFRQTITQDILDPDGNPIGTEVLNQQANRLFPINDLSGGAAAASFGVAYPPLSSTTVSLLGNLNADGTEGPSSGIVLPNGLNGTATGTDDSLISVVWGLAPTPVANAGTFIIARLTSNVPLLLTGGVDDIISLGSSVNTIVGGSPGARVDVPSLFLVPEPTMGFALAGLGLLGLRRRK